MEIKRTKISIKYFWLSITQIMQETRQEFLVQKLIIIVNWTWNDYLSQ